MVRVTSFCILDAIDGIFSLLHVRYDMLLLVQARRWASPPRLIPWKGRVGRANCMDLHLCRARLRARTRHGKSYTTYQVLRFRR